jgi:hypothetical protein
MNDERRWMDSFEQRSIQRDGRIFPLLPFEFLRLLELGAGADFFLAAVSWTRSGNCIPIRAVTPGSTPTTKVRLLSSKSGVIMKKRSVVKVADARARGEGWRIDYAFVSRAFFESQVLDVAHLCRQLGSDHCPGIRFAQFFFFCFFFIRSVSHCNLKYRSSASSSPDTEAAAAVASAPNARSVVAADSSAAAKDTFLFREGVVMLQTSVALFF